MGTFTPPLTSDGPRIRYDWEGDPLAMKLSQHVGRPAQAEAVFLYTDGTAGNQFPPPAWTDSSVDPWSLVTRVFYGARSYTVDSTEQTALENAGYTVT